MKLVNLTGHHIYLMRTSANVERIPPEGYLTAVDLTVPFVKIEGLPEEDPKGETLYAVTAEIKNLHPDREDLIVPMLPIDIGGNSVFVVDIPGRGRDR